MSDAPHSHALSASTAPQHTGQPLQTDELALMRVPGSFFDAQVQVRAIDGCMALVFIKGRGSQPVELSWLRRPLATR